MLEQRRVRYHGTVQGVGFRWTTQALARGFAVCGWVQNLPDGTVSLLVEGQREEVETFLREVSERMRPHIRRQEVRTSPATGGVQGFTIRY